MRKSKLISRLNIHELLSHFLSNAKAIYQCTGYDARPEFATWYHDHPFIAFSKDIKVIFSTIVNFMYTFMQLEPPNVQFAILDQMKNM